jgi:hypothetical protein
MHCLTSETPQNWRVLRLHGRHRTKNIVLYYYIIIVQRTDQKTRLLFRYSLTVCSATGA